MKTSFYLIIILAFLFTACQKNINGDLTAGTTGTVTPPVTGSSIDCKACTYYPVCNSIYYSYNNVTYTGFDSVTTPYHDSLSFIKDTSINNNPFTKIYSTGGASNLYYNCTGGATRLITYSSPAMGSNTITVTDITLLKANLPVGGAWQDTLVYPTLQMVNKRTIAEKGISYTVNGLVFPDVIHVKVQSGNLSSPFFVAQTIGDYYYAKAVGLIELKISSATQQTILHESIKSYHIP